MPKHNHNSPKGKVSFLNVLQSTVAAAFGVQSEKNRKRDFTQGKPSTFIFAGVIFMVIFIIAVYSVVQIVLSTSNN